eukprot:TRINITY_DN3960_c0_g1_i1.p1 TRINITY_DN3960_c0_g1~~TRINITY_DN3960_c0_g1_i1.p1  ORF type:complete len:207 (+),score=60.25 TRINITY_DN3960_c0_g1_i1:79-621(+)
MSPSKFACLLAAAAVAALMPAAFVVPAGVSLRSPQRLPQKLSAGAFSETSATTGFTTATFLAAVTAGLLAGVITGPRSASASPVTAGLIAGMVSAPEMAAASHFDATNYMEMKPTEAKVLMQNRATEATIKANRMQHVKEQLEKEMRIQEIKEALQKCKLCIAASGLDLDDCDLCEANQS